jgi:hypothetical protein
VPPLTPLYDGSTVLQRSLFHFQLQMGDREDISTSRLKPCTGGTSMPTAWPAPEGNARRPSASASTSRLHHRQRQLTLEPFFLASLPGFLHAQGKHPQAATPQPRASPWQRDYTFFTSFAASLNKEAVGSSVGTPQRDCRCPSSQHEFNI